MSGRAETASIHLTEANTAVLDASERIATTYVELLETGMSEDIVGRAMIGATIHFYEAIGQLNTLPTIFRRTARNIEIEFPRSASPSNAPLGQR